MPLVTRAKESIKIPVRGCRFDEKNKVRGNVSEALSFAQASIAMAEDLSGYLAGLVLSCEEIPKKDKLKKLSIDIGADEPVDVVTNAGNVGTRTVGCRVVVATVGAELRDGATVQKTAVGGVSSTGMLCDGPMLGWSGGGAGTAVLLPDAFNPGDPCPRSRPRLDGGSAAEPAAAPVAKSTGPGVDSLFEKKLSKEEKKAALAAKRAAKKAAKEAGGDGRGDEDDQ